MIRLPTQVADEAGGTNHLPLVVMVMMIVMPRLRMVFVPLRRERLRAAEIIDPFIQLFVVFVAMVLPFVLVILVLPLVFARLLLEVRWKVVWFLVAWKLLLRNALNRRRFLNGVVLRFQVFSAPNCVQCV